MRQKLITLKVKGLIEKTDLFERITDVLND